MPWDERSRMDQRVEFIGAAASCRYRMIDLCRAFGISRKTGYKWLRRYAEEGVEGLRDRSRAPRRCPHRSDPRCERALVEERERHPRWGPRKLLVLLREREPDWPWPAPSTAGEILKRHGLVAPRRRRSRRPAPPRPDVQATDPNELWTADFKGEFRLGDRSYCYPLTVADRASRFLLACRAHTSTCAAPVRKVFEELFTHYGLPRKILTDSGTPFASPRTVRRLSRLSAWWIELGIEPVLIQPGHPEQNGAHERMHRTLKAETARPPGPTPRAQQQRFDGFRREYNEQRPHEALDMDRPAARYRPSASPYSSQAHRLDYPGHFEIRRVRSTGEIKWRGRLHFVSEVLYGHTVGLEESDDHIWSLRFGSLLLGTYDDREQTLDLL